MSVQTKQGSETEEAWNEVFLPGEKSDIPNNFKIIFRDFRVKIKSHLQSSRICSWMLDWICQTLKSGRF